MYTPWPDSYSWCPSIFRTMCFVYHHVSINDDDAHSVWVDRIDAHSLQIDCNPDVALLAGQTDRQWTLVTRASNQQTTESGPGQASSGDQIQSGNTQSLDKQWSIESFDLGEQ